MVLFVNKTKDIRDKSVRFTKPKMLVLAICALVSFASFIGNASANSRIKDIAAFEGVRDNILIGYGLVVGLKGTGDSLDSMAFTKESLTSMLERLGVNVRDGKVDTDNVAAVMVTAIV